MQRHVAATLRTLGDAYLTLSTYQFGGHGTFQARIVGPLSWEQHMLRPEEQPKSSSFRIQEKMFGNNNNK